MVDMDDHKSIDFFLVLCLVLNKKYIKEYDKKIENRGDEYGIKIDFDSSVMSRMIFRAFYKYVNKHNKIDFEKDDIIKAMMKVKFPVNLGRWFRRKTVSIVVSTENDFKTWVFKWSKSRIAKFNEVLKIVKEREKGTYNENDHYDCNANQVEAFLLISSFIDKAKGEMKETIKKRIESEEKEKSEVKQYQKANKLNKKIVENDDDDDHAKKLKELNKKIFGINSEGDSETDVDSDNEVIIINSDDDDGGVENSECNNNNNNNNNNNLKIKKEKNKLAMSIPSLLNENHCDISSSSSSSSSFSSDRNSNKYLIEHVFRSAMPKFVLYVSPSDAIKKKVEENHKNLILHFLNHVCSRNCNVKISFFLSYVKGFDLLKPWYKLLFISGVACDNCRKWCTSFDLLHVLFPDTFIYVSKLYIHHFKKMKSSKDTEHACNNDAEVEKRHRHLISKLLNIIKSDKKIKEGYGNRVEEISSKYINDIGKSFFDNACRNCTTKIALNISTKNELKKASEKLQFMYSESCEQCSSNMFDFEKMSGELKMFSDFADFIYQEKGVLKKKIRFPNYGKKNIPTKNLEKKN